MTDSPDKAKRDSMIERVRKLSRMTTAAGASEAEAQMAATHMARLIAEYNIGQTELTVKVDAQHCIMDEFMDASTRRTPWSTTCRAVAELFSVRYYFTNRLEDLFDIGVPVSTFVVVVYGFPTDVAATLGMFQIIHNAISHESDIFWAGLKGRQSSKVAARESFELGMANRLAERLKEIKLAQTPASAGRGLMVLKDQLVTDQFAAMLKTKGMRLGTARSLEIRDRGAFAAGHVKGGAVSLQPGVGRTHQLR